MATFLLFGKYTQEGLQAISAQRTQRATEIIQKFGGSVKAGYATLGKHDLVLVLDLPGTEEAMKTSLALTKLTSIGFITAPAVTLDAFDRLAAET